MPWWGWVLVAWPFLAAAIAYVVGKSIQMADREQVW